jgi:hypothetical protein
MRSLDFRVPDFDLIEPRRIGRRVMNAYFRMTSQKSADRLGFMCAQVTADDVNGSFWSLDGRCAYSFLFGKNLNKVDYSSTPVPPC